MKKIVLIIVAIVCSIYTHSQHKLNLPDEAAQKRFRVILDPAYDLPNIPLDAMNAPLQESNILVSETLIGETFYDLPSNRMLGNRLYRYPDETIGAVWIMGFEDAPNFPDRGTGYNYYDGTEWGPIPSTRIESFRAGWPSYAPLGPEGEIVVCHDFAAATIYTLTRPVKFQGDWTETLYEYASGPPKLACPRMITAGPDHSSIHILVSSYEDYLGQESAMVYSRSQDGGQTWNIQNIILEGTGSNYYSAIWVDNYVWADEKDGTIALLCASLLWHDMFMMKSTDDGDTWEKTVIWEHPYPFYNENTVVDTLFCVDGSANIALDNSGKAHVVFGISKIWKPESGGFVYLDPYCDGIGYWNEDMEPFSNDHHALAPPGYGYENSEMVEDYNYIGWMQDIDGNGTIDLNSDIFFYSETLGASTMPAITINDVGEIYVLFASTTETYEYDDYNLKHIFGRAYCLGEWWPIVHLTGDIMHIFDESIHPVMATLSDENIYYYIHTDATPGYASFYNAHPHQENRIVYAQAERWELCYWGVDEFGVSNGNIDIDIQPNPCVEVARLRYLIHDTGSLSSSRDRYLISGLYGIDGKKIRELVNQEVVPGEYEIEINVSDFPAGIYLVKMQMGKELVVRKLVVSKS